MRKLLTLTLALSCFLLTACLTDLVSRQDPGQAQPKPVTIQVSTTDARSRVFLVVVDFSKSYRDFEAVINSLISELKDLGPGDRFVLARIPAALDPKDFVLIDASMIKPSDEIFLPSKNLNQWRRKRRVLDDAWRRAFESSKTIAAELQKLRGANTGTKTDLHGAIPYSVRWLNSQSAVEATLIICSDLEHDTGASTFTPPETLVNAQNLRIRLLFISYGNSQHWKKIENDWKRYFNGAAAFEMLDSGRSPNAIFSPNSVPRTLPSLLSTSQGGTD
jgi:hypothetical protein